MAGELSGHVVAACGKASGKIQENPSVALYSTVHQY